MVSPIPSPPPEAELADPSSLETLVSHLVASKRSLSSIEHVLRANEIVTSTRVHLKASVIISSRTSFLRAGINTQLRTLGYVHKHNRAIELEGAEEYREALRTLDDADGRLKGTLNRLRTTMVEASLRPESDSRESLLDFVDEGGVDELLVKAQESANAAQKAHAKLVETNLAFHTELQEIANVLRSSQVPKNEYLLGNEGRYSDVNGSSTSPLPDILQSMEDRAKSMADNLESLVKHFDLCVTAVKHTEGGGDTAQKLTHDLPAGMNVGEEVLGAPSELISEQERQEMLDILAKDADQVEEVVMEIHDHIGELEAQFDTVGTYMSHLEQESSNLATAFKRLDSLGSRLHAFVAQSQVFVMRWDDEKAKISERMEELESLGDFYIGYVSAYDNLLVEIGRRQFMEQQMEKVVQDAMRKLDTLYEEDRAKREAFRDDYGDFLPMDIWPGLTDPPLQFETRPINEVEKVPEISKSVIQRAIRRVEGKA
ncbi:MAG: hypothetical protein Q9201_000823 [Fulgogasparrea decipioides]